MGAGGGARAVVASLAERGAKEIRVANRTPARAEALARDFGTPVRAIPWEQRHDALDGAALLVNTTSLGMPGQPPMRFVVSPTNDKPIDAGDLLVDRMPEIHGVVVAPRPAPGASS